MNKVWIVIQWLILLFLLFLLGDGVFLAWKQGSPIRWLISLLTTGFYGLLLYLLSRGKLSLGHSTWGSLFMILLLLLLSVRLCGTEGGGAPSGYSLLSLPTHTLLTILFTALIAVTMVMALFSSLHRGVKIVITLAGGYALLGVIQVLAAHAGLEKGFEGFGPFAALPLVLRPFFFAVALYMPLVVIALLFFIIRDLVNKTPPSRLLAAMTAALVLLLLAGLSPFLKLGYLRGTEKAVNQAAFTSKTGPVNYLALWQGGEVTGFSSELDRHAHGARNLNDGRTVAAAEAGWWQPGPGAPFPHEITFAVAGEKGEILDRVTIHNAASQGARAFEVLGSPSLSGTYAPLGRFEARNSPSPQVFSFPPTRVKCLKIRILSSWDTSGTGQVALYEIEASGDAPLAPVMPSRNLLTEEEGAEARSGERVEGKENLVREGEGGGCRVTGPLPSEIVLSMARQRSYLISTVVISVPPGRDGLRDFEIGLSGDPVKGFKKMGRWLRARGEKNLKVSFAPRSARFIRVKVLSTYKGNEVEISRIQAFQPPLAAGPSPSSLPGLNATYYNGLTFGSTTKETVDPSPAINWTAGGAVPLPPGCTSEKFAVEWKGMIQVSRDGLYELAVRSDDAFILTLDDTRTLDNEKSFPVPMERKTLLSLSKGLHPLRLLYCNREGGAACTLAWRQEAAGELSPVPEKAFFHHPTGEKEERTPRRAAQEGLNWLEPGSLAWQKSNRCFGCHVQTHALIGLSIARQNSYRTSPESMARLQSFLSAGVGKDGTLPPEWAGTAFTTAHYMGLWMSYCDRYTDFPHREVLARMAGRLITSQEESGFFPNDHHDPPIDQGEVMATVNSLLCIERAWRITGDRKFRDSLEKGLAWLRGATVNTTQDRIFQLMGLSLLDKENSKSLIRQKRRDLLAQQHPDGGWSELPAMESNAYATGEALYALKVTGMSVADGRFMKGVQYLMDRQQLFGSWRCDHSQSLRPSDYAPTMWAVIGLAGSFESFVVSMEKPDDDTRIKLADESAREGEIRARIFNSTGSPVREVQFFVDGTLVGKKDREPFVISWSPRSHAPGPHTLKVAGTTGGGHTSEDEKEIYLAGKLSIAITSPEARHTCTGKVVITPAIENETGSPAKKVDYRIENKSIGTSTAPPFTIEWNSADVPTGEHVLSAAVENEKGEVALCEHPILTGKALRIAIAEPREGDRLDRAIELQSEVYNLTGSPVKEVEYLKPDRSSLGTAAAPPWRLKGDISALTEGNAVIKAIARTEKGESAEGSVSVEICRPFEVTLYATATDQGGRYVVTLQKDDFALSENEKPQAIDRVVKSTDETPLSVVIALDGSGSMAPATAETIAAARQFVSLLSPKDRAAIVIFDDRVRVATPFTGDRNVLTSAIAALDARGGTSLYDSIYRASELLKDEKGRKAIVVLTDGVDENGPGTAPGSFHSQHESLERAKERDCIIYAIGLGRGVNEKVLKGFSDATGGRSYMRPAAKDLRDTYGQIAEELRCQYVITYHSTDTKKNGAFRTVKVTTPKKACQVHTKPGYYAPSY